MSKRGSYFGGSTIIRDKVPRWKRQVVGAAIVRKSVAKAQARFDEAKADEETTRKIAFDKMEEFYRRKAKRVEKSRRPPK